MEMRARESVSMSKDLTGEITPFATALHDVFLHSHCSSCFTKLLPQTPCVMSCMTCCSLRYCCSECLRADSVVHVSSGECCFFVDHLKRASPSYVTEGTSDLRAALRLLCVLEIHGLVSPDSINHYSRIGGLSASGIEEALKEGEVIAERILEGSLLMSSARKSRAQTCVIFSDRLKLEKMALWAVIINSVEVQLSEGLALGVAVYGPSFSWFNHSCFPSASYRFVLAPRNEDCASQKSKSSVVPASKGVAADVWHAWQYEDHSTHGTSLRSTRCIASPEPYTDLILNCDVRDLDKAEAEGTVTPPAIENLGDVLQQAISEYTSNDDPEACCDMIETMLSNRLVSGLKQEDISGRKHILQPLHHICLTAYMTLASAYRFRALSLEEAVRSDGENTDEFFRMAKAAAAYSLVLAGSTHHLFLSECSLMIPLSHFLLNTGQSLLYLVESIKGKTRQNISEARLSFSSCPASSTDNDSPPYHVFRSTCEAFGKQMLSLSLRCWSFLVRGLPCLEKIKSPMEFSMPGTTIFQSVLSEEDHANLSAHEPVGFTERQAGCILSLALCCITYCKYLATICYGPHHYLADHAKYLLEGIDPAQ
ncbi:protein SET DOMAIN GROUP 41 isoform X2 [Zea mays]|uniref:Protein SET DOMAIN GROUP 41 n=1 Tax=Zea mays TaxID=4577 RepID=A0A1D6EB08_MAIZE|nr:protein SET DOMAIN GROUP 41 isoform X2 [Zea mays]ONM17540.1 Protein SET DOMAIN GROUP 41 [Zea mays]|eukprot:XP_008669421.1 protein SET DOMAIN GROUP 41 isoform X2 [Zea mays]